MAWHDCIYYLLEYSNWLRVPTPTMHRWRAGCVADAAKDPSWTISSSLPNLPMLFSSRIYLPQSFRKKKKNLAFSLAKNSNRTSWSFWRTKKKKFFFWKAITHLRLCQPVCKPATPPLSPPPLSKSQNPNDFISPATHLSQSSEAR